METIHLLRTRSDGHVSFLLHLVPILVFVAAFVFSLYFMRISHNNDVEVAGMYTSVDEEQAK